MKLVLESLDWNMKHRGRASSGCQAVGSGAAMRKPQQHSHKICEREAKVTSSGLLSNSDPSRRRRTTDVEFSGDVFLLEGTGR